MAETELNAQSNASKSERPVVSELESLPVIETLEMMLGTESILRRNV